MPADGPKGMRTVMRDHRAWTVATFWSGDERPTRTFPRSRLESDAQPFGSSGKLMHVTAARRAAPPTPPPSPEEMLRKAMVARSPAARARWARQGLAAPAPIDKTTHAMLLRQLYLSRYETHRFGDAYAVALEALALDVLRDVLHQDAARAALAAGEVDRAVSHLRIAARRGPPSRRPFHWWTLGATLFLAHRYAEAIPALERAVRWGTRDKPLYRAHLALVRIASGERVDGLQATIDELAAAPCGQGYGRFVLGHLAYAAGAWPAAHRYLEAFLRRVDGSRRLLAIALGAEVKMARATLGKMAAN
jgi:tetratricopeptide (TPR) repeat protein